MGEVGELSYMSDIGCVIDGAVAVWRFARGNIGFKAA
jgi:uncharacterized membrane protein